MIPERQNKATVMKILDNLIDNDLLKVGSIEGMDQYFEGLEKIIEDSRQDFKKKFMDYAYFWGEMNHKRHSILDISFEDCDNEVCISIRNTIHELE